MQIARCRNPAFRTPILRNRSATGSPGNGIAACHPGASAERRPNVSARRRGKECSRGIPPCRRRPVADVAEGALPLTLPRYGNLEKNPEPRTRRFPDRLRRMEDPGERPGRLTPRQDQPLRRRIRNHAPRRHPGTTLHPCGGAAGGCGREQAFADLVGFPFPHEDHGLVDQPAQPFRMPRRRKLRRSRKHRLLLGAPDEHRFGPRIPHRPRYGRLLRSLRLRPLVLLRRPLRGNVADVGGIPYHASVQCPSRIRSSSSSVRWA